MNLNPASVLDLGTVNVFASFAFAPKGNLVAYQATNIVVCDLKSKTRVEMANSSNPAKYIHWTADGKQLTACIGTQLRVWDVESGKAVIEFEFTQDRRISLNGLCAGNTPNTWYLLTNTDSRLLQYDAKANTLQERFVIGKSKTVPKTKFSAVGHALARIDENRLVISVRPGFLIYDLRDDSEQFVEVGNGHGIPRLAVSSDEKLLALQRDQIVELFRTDTWKSVAICQFQTVGIDGDKEQPSAIHFAITKDGSYIVATASLGIPRPSYLGVFQTTDGKNIGQWKIDDDIGVGLGLSPDNNTLLTSGVAGTKVWDFQAIVKQLQPKK
jgi:hypothetical protein